MSEQEATLRQSLRDVWAKQQALEEAEAAFKTAGAQAEDAGLDVCSIIAAEYDGDDE